jgi:transposase-like protein
MFDETVEDLLLASESSPPAWISGQAARSGKVTDTEIGEALLRNNYNVAATATSVGIHRSTLYDWMGRNPGAIRPANDLTDDEIVAAYDRHGGDIAVMATELRVPPKRLKARVTEALRIRPPRR